MDLIIYTLVVTHITIVSVTIFLHRGQAHRGIEFNPVLEHFMRFWLWLTTGMVENSFKEFRAAEKGSSSREIAKMTRHKTLLDSDLPARFNRVGSPAELQTRN